MLHYIEIFSLSKESWLRQPRAFMYEGAAIAQCKALARNAKIFARVISIWQDDEEERIAA